jgi:hypothetical protein
VKIDNDSEDWSAINSLLDPLLQRARASQAREMPPLPPQARPSPELLKQASARALQEFDLAKAAFEQGDGVAAEEAVIRSIAFGHWSRDRLGRAAGFMMLGSIERFLLKYPNEAVSAYFLALDLLEALLPTSDLANTWYEPLATQLTAYLKELGDPKRADAVAERLSVVKEWQSESRKDQLAGQSPAAE